MSILNELTHFYQENYLSGIFCSSEHEEAAAWLPQYAYDDDGDEDDEGDDGGGGGGDSQFLPLEESHQARDDDNDDDDDTNTRNGDDESMNSLIGSTYRASKRTVDHPDPQVSRSLFLLSNLASSLYGGGGGGGAGSRAASKPAVEEYELQEMSEEFPTTRKGDPISSDYLGTSFGSGNIHEEEDDSADAEDHGDWLVDTEQLLNPQFEFPDSGSGSGVEAVESSSTAFIVTPSNNSSGSGNRNDDAGNAIPSTKDTDEKLSFQIDDVSASYSPTTQYMYISQLII